MVSIPMYENTCQIIYINICLRHFYVVFVLSFSSKPHAKEQHANNYILAKNYTGLIIAFFCLLTTFLGVSSFEPAVAIALAGMIVRVTIQVAS